MRVKISASQGRFLKAMVGVGRGWVLWILVLMSGCAVYHPMPITTETVNARLQHPDWNELRMLASRISHPILRPVNLEPDKGLTPDAAAVLAVLLNPSLRAMRDQRAVADAQLLNAGLLPNPELAFSLDVPTGGDTAGKTTAFGLGLNWPLDSLFSRAIRRAEEKRHKEAVELDIAWQEWQVAQGAKAAVYELVSLQNQIALAERADKRMAQYLTQIQDAIANGSLTIGPLNAAKAASRQADQNLLKLRKRADQQRLLLRRLIGLQSGAPIFLNNDIHLPSRFATPAAAILFKELDHRRLDLMALRRGYSSQEAAVRAAIMEQFPKISLGPTISRDSDNLKTTGFGLNIVLPIINRNQGGIAHARATRQQLFDEYVNRVFEARSDIERIISGIHYLNARIAPAQAAEKDLASLVDNYRSALADGRTDASIYYAAWSDLISAKAKKSDLEGRLAQAVVTLELAAGFYEIPKSDLSPDPSATESGEKKTP